MNNLYYGYRGDSAAQRGPAPPPSQHQQHLTSSKEPSAALHQPSNIPAFPISNVQQGIQLRPAPGQQPAQQSPAFPNHQAWAADQQVALQTNPQHQPSSSQHQPSIVNTPFQPSQPTRPAVTHGMNGTRTGPITSRQLPAYEDNLFQIMGKGYADGNPRASTQLSSAIGHQLPISSPPDQYSQLRSTASSNVFDPSEFPSLGGNMGSQGAMQSATSSLLGSSPGLDSTGLGNIGLPPTSMNGLSAYQDLYSLGGYGDGRAKAVDALTGSSAAAEFSMQSEDFPALGGASGGSSIRAAGMMPGGVNGGSNPQAPGSLGPASSLDKMTDSFYDRNISTVSQPHSVLGRVQPRSEQVSNPMLIGRGGHIANGYQISEALSASVSQAERSSHAPSALQQRGLHLELSSSPPRGGFPTHMPIQPMNPRSKATSADAEQNTTEDYDILGRGKDSSIRQGHSNSSAKSVANGDTIGARGRLPNGPGVTGAESNTPILSQTANSSDSVAKRASTSADAAPDKYGMKALLPIVLPMSESNGKNENILSVGLDLTALGLNLNSQEPLHKTFENPWEGGQGASGSADNSGSSPKNQDPEYRLPTCYYMQPPALRSSHFNKFQLETLFYIFYNMPHDVLQLLAAVELYNRKWRYHKTLKLWFTCDPEAAGSYETPGYVYFDIKSWERRQFHEANPSFIQGLMTEEELNAVKIPSL